MKQAQSPFAEELLRRVRATADPGTAIAQRVLQGVEHRVGDLGAVERGSGPGGAPPPLPEPRPIPSHPGMRISGHLRALFDAGARTAAAKLARWVFFGLATGSVGYLWGHATRDTRGVDELSPRGAHAAHSQSPSSEGEGLHAPELNPTVAAAHPSVALEPMVTPAPGAPIVAPPRADSVGKSTARAAGKTTRRRMASKGGDVALSRLRAPLSLREVLEMLEHAQARLRNGEPGEALRWLGELDRQSPGAPLMEERLVTRTLAACELGELAQAQHASRELQRLDAESIYRGRLEASCVAMPLLRDPE